MIKLKTISKKLIADTLTPVSIYYKVRDRFPNSIMLESSDYKGKENSRSFICLQSIASFKVEANVVSKQYPNQAETSETVENLQSIPEILQNFISEFKVENEDNSVNGFFGYTTFDAVKYFENIKFQNSVQENYKIPEIRYSLYKFIITIDHFKNEMTISENILNNEESQIPKIEKLLLKVFTPYDFKSHSKEKSNITDDEFMKMVRKGKEHAYRGDVFQIVLSRQFSRQFSGDEFKVYRALRSINPSPYLFYFDYGAYKLFGSSPEAQLTIKNNKAVINPIAGTYLRSGDEKTDKELAEKLLKDPKESAEHVMLVDLARNDLSRNSSKVKLETFSEVQYYSHVIHLVSNVSAELEKDTMPYKVFADTFPAGTLSGAPKFKAMELIDKYENQNRGYYGGGIGLIGFNGDVNHAIMIRTFLSKNNTLFYQAGAGIVAKSDEKLELQEVNNKLGALKSAILLAQNI
jgi:anthranilate synthase component 1